MFAIRHDSAVMVDGMTLAKTKLEAEKAGAKAAVRVLIVPDKFKGTLPASEVCAAIARGWNSVRAKDPLAALPMSDGGDGFGVVLGQLLKARRRSVPALDAAHQPMTAAWWWEPDRRLAIIESAVVIGMEKLAARRLHPFQLDTFGVGRVLKNAIQAGARRCVIGVGGSATNDGGFGLGRALGWRFLDRSGQELEEWWQLGELVRVTPPKTDYKTEITVAVDVANPLLGPRGCSRVYGPQKGIRPGDLVLTEKCLTRLAAVMAQQLGINHAAVAGAGAAGGLGFGLMAFAGAKPRSGFEVFAEAAGLEGRIRQSDLVITGEGAIDHQTFMGKGVGEIIRLCKKCKIPCVAFGGVARVPTHVSKASVRIHALTDMVTLEQAQKEPAKHLEKLSAAVARIGFRNGHFLGDP
jgi:glycerate kinase